MIEKKKSYVIQFITFLAGFLLTCLLFYPGFLNSDSDWQLYQAKNNVYDPQHPVFISHLWLCLLYFFDEIGGMFLLQTFSYWIGLTALLGLLINNRNGFMLGTLGVGLYPPLFAGLLMIVKDSLFYGAPLSALSALALAERKISKLNFSLCIFFSFLAVLLRHNGIFAILPILFYLFVVLFKSIDSSFFKKRLIITLSAITGSILIGGTMFVAKGFYEARAIGPTYIRSSEATLIFDLARVSVLSNKNYLPDVFGAGPITLEDLNKIPSTYSVFDLLYGDNSLRRPGYSRGSSNDTLLLKQAWRSSIINEPCAYLKHRATVFTGLMGLAPTNSWPYWYHNTDLLMTDKKLSPDFNVNFKIWLVEKMDKLRVKLYFRTWPYVVALSVLLLLKAIFRIKFNGYEYTAQAIVLSGLAYLLGYFIVAPSIDWRYTWWFIQSVLIFGVITINAFLVRLRS